MKIGFVSENGFLGKVPDDFDNARTEYCWQQNLDAYHTPLTSISSLDLGYDLIIFIIPKKLNIGNDISIVEHLKHYSKKVAVMQEGSFWNFQDFNLAHQIWYSNEYATADYIFCHNESDARYYRGIYVGKPVMVLRTAMNPSTITDIKQQKNAANTIIGGNFCSWYGGFDSYMVANEFDNEIYAPAMGRKKEGEEQVLNILPYMNWTNWMKTLSKFKYGVHLMRTFGAGTFAMNCAYFGIPCIGYNGLDTQTTLHPHTSVDVGDIEAARKLAKMLKNDTSFYDMCSDTAKANVRLYSDRNTWLDFFHTQLATLQR